MSKYIVTGGAGFIGSNLVKRLLSDKHIVLIIDNLSSGFIEYLPKHPYCYFLNADISDYKSLLRFEYLAGNTFKYVEGVFHVAAQSRIQPAIKDPDLAHDNNVTGIYNILKLMKEKEIKKIVFSSSSSIYGLKNGCPQNEEMSADCLNPYSVSKYIGEQYIKTWCKLYGISGTCLRYFNVWGPREPINLSTYNPVIGLFFKQILKEKKPLTIVGDGSMKRDFCLTKDARILMSDLTWKRIEDVKIGENVLSFDEICKNRKRKFKISKVKNKIDYISNNVYEIKFIDGSIVRSTGNHPWLTPKGFKSTDKLLNSLNNGFVPKIRFFGNCSFFINNIESKDLSLDFTNINQYKKGYIVGALDGDGYLTKRIDKRNGRNLYCSGLGVSDKVFSEYFNCCCKEFNINLNYKIRKIIKDGKKYKDSHVLRTNKYKNYSIFNNFFDEFSLKDEDFIRGYMCGLFDAEGEYSKSLLRISNKSNKILNNISNILDMFNFKYSKLEKKDGLFYITVLGGLNEHVRFFSIFPNKILRKRPDFENREVKGCYCEVESIKKIDSKQVFSLEIENTHTFIANGLLCHNTHVSDVVEANVKAMNYYEPMCGEVFNIGTGKNYSILELANIVLDCLGMDESHIKFIPARPAESRATRADNAKAYDWFGWEPKIKLEEEIYNHRDYYLNLFGE
jgi:nucleoside-diphosphate-sugar epimerase